MIIRETNIPILGYMKDENNLPKLLITSVITHKWSKPFKCEYKDDIRDHGRLVELLNSEPFYASGRMEEYAWLVCMRTHGELIGVFELSHGGLNTTIMDYRVLMAKAILAGSAHILIAHNHPTGNPTPSKADKVVTEELYQIATLHKIDLYDHIILGKDGYSSILKELNKKNKDDFDFLHRVIYDDKEESVI